jgi:NAD(P)-dependent dehydrogenase (short-subunit alcohol dehydrogenase family)
LTTPPTIRPLGFGRPEDIANTAAFPPSGDATFIVGERLTVVGGTDLQIRTAYPGEQLT